MLSNWLAAQIYKIFHPTEAYKLKMWSVAYGSSVAGQIAQEQGVNIPPTVGEMATQIAEDIGGGVIKVFSFLKWILIFAVIVFIAWLFWGRK